MSLSFFQRPSPKYSPVNYGYRERFIDLQERTVTVASSAVETTTTVLTVPAGNTFQLKYFQVAIYGDSTSGTANLVYTVAANGTTIWSNELVVPVLTSEERTAIVSLESDQPVTEGNTITITAPANANGTATIYATFNGTMTPTNYYQPRR